MSLLEPQTALGISCCGACCYMIIFLIVSLNSFKILGLTECALQIDETTKTIDESKIYTAGLYNLGLFQGFYTFPLDVQVIEFNDESVSTSDFLSIRLSFVVHYQLRNTKEGEILSLYRNYQTPEKVKSQLRSLVLEKIKQLSTSSIPSDDYSVKRTEVRELFRQEIEKSFDSLGISLNNFFLLNVQFSETFEANIISKIVAAQAIIRTGFDTEIQLINKEIEQYYAIAYANETIKLSTATNYGIKIRAEATAEGFLNLTNVRASEYSNITETLDFNQKELMQYLWLRAVKSKTTKPNSKTKLVAGFASHDSNLRDLLSASSN